MKKKVFMSDIIEEDFKVKNRNEVLELKFLRSISKSKVYLSKKTGLVFHKDRMDPKENVKHWTRKMFKKKMNPKKGFYTDDSPIMSSRHQYLIEFLNKNIKLNNQLFCDFGAGEGGLLIKLRKNFKKLKLIGTEISHSNILMMKSRFKKNKVKFPRIANTSIEDFNLKQMKLTKKIDIASLSWTLCNCQEPLKIIKKIKENLKKNGLLIVGESSRVLVPFKKPIYNCFNKDNDISGKIHPWHWSFNSLKNIFKLFGFTILAHNRYFDENDLVIIFKNSNNYKQNFECDNYKEVLNFFSRWKRESKNYLNFK
tara:strand:- start:6445 stop:7377 length:933 start_codon:yes stop_codon:yes gene_type:complete